MTLVRRALIPSWSWLACRPSLASQVRLPTFAGHCRRLNGGPSILPGGEEEEQQQQQKSERYPYKQTAFKMIESAMTTLASISVLGLIGYSYTQFYKTHVVRKIEHAFEPGDPIVALASEGKDAPSAHDSHTLWIDREEQKRINDIVHGKEKGKYFIVIGEKGTGKSSMLIEAVAKVDGDGIAFFDAHADPEIFRVRFGKALDFEFHEDNIGGLFSIRGPRDASALLDIERAFNKLEKVALKRRQTLGKPIVLIMNGMHLVRDDDDGKDLIELIQQRAEQWAASNLCTMVFNSDDYWIYERLKVQATRMEVVPVFDLIKPQALEVLKMSRRRWYNDDLPDEEFEKVYDRIGGRLAYLTRVARARDMMRACDEICWREKSWFLSQCGILGEEMDDDVMDQQKFASAAMVLAKALVDMDKELDKTYHPETGHILPEIPLHRARYIMTRADFIQAYDHLNLFTIDSKAMVRADSVPMMNAFREICSDPGFEDFLQATLDRISAIESLGRTREISLKDLWNKGQYEIKTRNARGQLEKSTLFEVVPKEEEEEEEEEDGN